MPPRGIEVEGLKEFVKAVRRSADNELPKRVGEANKKIGELVIERLTPAPTPAAVGEGTGAAVRASAAKREVLLRVGGAHRKNPPLALWGKRSVTSRREPRPPRPYIKQTAEDNLDDIGQEWIDAIRAAMDPAFFRTE